MRRRTRFVTIFLAVLALCLGLAASILAENAVSVQMMKTEGEVSVTNNSAHELTVMEKMRLYNGYFVSTDEKSYAWINLDDTKLVKLDAVSQMELRKDGKKLELLMHEGELVFNVTEPLEDDETMDICTATMVAGIRGTFGWAKKVSDVVTELGILEGKTECTFTDPATGERKTVVVKSGNVAQFRMDGEKGISDVKTQKIKREDIPGNVQVEVADNPELKDKIYDASGLDLSDLTVEEAEERQKQDEAEIARRAKDVASKIDKTRVISKDPVWKTPSDDSTERTTEPASENVEEPETELPTETMTEPETESETTPATESETTVPATESETTPASETTPVTESETTAPATESETTPPTESETAASATESETTPPTESETTPVTESETEPVTEAPSESETESETEPVTEAPTETETESETEPVTEPVTEPETEPVTEPVTESETEPVTEVPTESETEPVTEAPQIYTVSFDGGSSIKDVQVTELSTVGANMPADPVREGHTFVGWYTADDKEFTSDTVVTGDLTVTARWNVMRYTVTYMLDGEQVGEAETYEYGASVTIREKATKEGYTVSAWDRTENFTMPAENVVIKATSTINSYTVTYQLDGEQVGEVETYGYGASVTIREKATKEGYTVTDWSKTEDFTMPAENVVIKATSTINSYTVTYQLDGEQVGDVETYEYGADVAIRAKAEKTGYTVTDWSRMGSFTMPAENVVITATSTINSYTVTYLLDGVQSGETETYVYGAIVTVRGKVEKTGYTVTDWSKTEDFTMPAENVTITATSTINSYAVTYLLDDKQVGEVETYKYGEPVTVRPKAEREGYTVSDWSQTEDFTMPAENVEITATSKVNSYTVTFDANGGNPETTDSVTVEYNKTVTLPAAPTRTGYTFQGWYTEKEEGEQFTELTAVTDDCTLYAHWTAANAEIVFDPNGGSGGPQKLTGVTDETISALFPTEQPTREGFTFVGWYPAEDGSGEAVTAYPSVFPAETTTYYAKWDYNTGDFTVTGGTPLVDYKYEVTADASVDGAGVLTILTGTPLTISGTTTKDTIKIGSGVSADVTLSDVNINASDYDSYLPAPVTVTGAASTVITLKGSNTLTASSGHAGLEKNDVDPPLTIRESGFGSLTAVSRGQAGIGSSGSDTGNITIESGEIYAEGYASGAGIGGAYVSNGSKITISGGTVTAIGNGGPGWGAGIGGGGYGNGTDIVITGGTVKAQGGAGGGAGIGGGLYGGAGTNITITGGNVTATGGSGGGAGIGGGGADQAYDGSVNKSGIGSNIEITGGYVKATGGSDAACIGDGSGGEGEKGSFTGGIVFKGTSGQVYGTVTLNRDLEIKSGETLHIPIGSKLIISDGVTLTNNGTITYEAEKQEDAISGSVSGAGEIKGPEATAMLAFAMEDLNPEETDSENIPTEPVTESETAVPGETIPTEGTVPTEPVTESETPTPGETIPTEQTDSTEKVTESETPKPEETTPTEKVTESETPKPEETTPTEKVTESETPKPEETDAPERVTESETPKPEETTPPEQTDSPEKVTEKETAAPQEAAPTEKETESAPAPTEKVTEQEAAASGRNGNSFSEILMNDSDKEAAW